MRSPFLKRLFEVHCHETDTYTQHDTGWPCTPPHKSITPINATCVIFVSFLELYHEI